MSSVHEPFLFHMIYTPGTVRALLPFVDTLLRWSDCAFCLVANGCGTAEVALLRARCAGEPRLSWGSLPWPHKVEHGQALNFLLSTAERSPFCFMDSDILATGDFMLELQPALAGAAGVFSAWPVTIKAGERVQPAACEYIGGRHSWTEHGECLGGSYFAIYERAALARALAAAPDGFNRGFWAQLPGQTQRFLREIGQQRLFYDTGRVLNLYLQTQGSALRVHDCAALLHLGSYSIYAGGGRSRPPQPRWLKSAKAIARRMRDQLTGQAYRSAVLRRVAQDPIQCLVDERRQLLTSYFIRLTAALAAGQAPPPCLEIQDVEIDDGIQRATQALILLLGKG